MNKSELINELEKKTGYTKEKCILINDVFENYFIIGKKNKEKIVQDLQEKLELSEDESENVYDIVMGIIAGEVKNKLKHPFKSKD